MSNGFIYPVLLDFLNLKTKTSTECNRSTEPSVQILFAFMKVSLSVPMREVTYQLKEETKTGFVSGTNFPKPEYQQPGKRRNTKPE